MLQQRINFIWKPTNFNYKMYCSIDNSQHKAGNLLAQFHQDNAQRDIKLQKPPIDLVVNHLENHRELTTKTGLVRSLKYYYKDNVNFVESTYQVFDTTPTSFVVGSHLDTYEYFQFLKRFQDLEKGKGQTIKEKLPQKHCLKNMWLIKPANENQGKGIKIFNDVDQIVRFLESSLKFSYWVIQKYLEKPLLFKGRKFDVRVWAFAQSNLDFFFYDTGYIRTSSEEYAVNTTNNDEMNMYVHLTNNCLQVQNKDTYGKHEEGNTISFEQFQEYLDQEYSQYGLNVQQHFVSRMKDIAIDCYLSSKNVLNPNKRRNSFEFFGFDFMIDEDFRVWLIEVNTNPYIGIHNKGMKHILPEMFDSLFKIVLDPVFDGQQAPDKANSDVLPNEDTGFDLLYSRWRGINKRRPVQEGIYPVKELDQRRTYPRKFKKPLTFKKKTDLEQQAIWIAEAEKLAARDQNSSSKNLYRDSKLMNHRDRNKSNTVRNRSPSNSGPSPLNVNQAPQIGQQSKSAHRKNKSHFTASKVGVDQEGKLLHQSPSIENIGSQYSLIQIDGQPKTAQDTNMKEDKPKPPKSILQQVKNLDKKSQFAGEQVQAVLNRILATMGSWELFSNEQLLDANTALRQIQQYTTFTPGQQLPILDTLMRLIGSNDLPIHIKLSVSQNICGIFKNKSYARHFLHDADESFDSLSNLYVVILESIFQPSKTPYSKGQDEEGDDLASSQQSTHQQDELVIECCSILISLLSLNTTKYYIPGETSQKAQNRQKSIDIGVLIFLIHVYNTTHESQSSASQLLTLLQEEFMDRLEESDIHYHFKHNHAQYERLSSLRLLQDSSIRQRVDGALQGRLEWLRLNREREQKEIIEKKRAEELKEMQLKQEYEEAMQERRRVAEERMQHRIRHLQKVQKDEAKQEMLMKEEQDKMQEIKKQEMIEVLRQKQETRKAHQLSLVRKKRIEERETEEEKEKERQQREEARRVALDEWHKSKRAEEKRKNQLTKMATKISSKKAGSGQHAANQLYERTDPGQLNLITFPNPLVTKRKSVVKKPAKFVEPEPHTKTVIDESFLKNAKISQLNKIQQNIQTLSHQRKSYKPTLPPNHYVLVENCQFNPQSQTDKREGVNHSSVTQTGVSTTDNNQGRNLITPMSREDARYQSFAGMYPSSRSPHEKLHQPSLKRTQDVPQAAAVQNKPPKKARHKRAEQQFLSQSNSKSSIASKQVECKRSSRRQLTNDSPSEKNFGAHLDEAFKVKSKRQKKNQDLISNYLGSTQDEVHHHLLQNKIHKLQEKVKLSCLSAHASGESAVDSNNKFFKGSKQRKLLQKEQERLEQLQHQSAEHVIADTELSHSSKIRIFDDETPTRVMKSPKKTLPHQPDFMPKRLNDILPTLRDSYIGRAQRTEQSIEELSSGIRLADDSLSIENSRDGLPHEGSLPMIKNFCNHQTTGGKDSIIEDQSRMMQMSVESQTSRFQKKRERYHSSLNPVDARDFSKTKSIALNTRASNQLSPMATPIPSNNVEQSVLTNEILGLKQSYSQSSLQQDENVQVIDRKRPKKNNAKHDVTGYENAAVASRTRRDRANNSVMPEIGLHDAQVAALKPLQQFASAAPTPKKQDSINLAHLHEMYKTGGALIQAVQLDPEAPNIQNFMMSERGISQHVSGQNSIVAKGTSLSIENPSTINADTANLSHNKGSYIQSAPPITLITNDYSQVNVTQNINIKKYVKKKKGNSSKKSKQSWVGNDGAGVVQALSTVLRSNLVLDEVLQRNLDNVVIREAIALKKQQAKMNKKKRSQFGTQDAIKQIYSQVNQLPSQKDQHPHGHFRQGSSFKNMALKSNSVNNPQVLNRTLSQDSSSFSLNKTNNRNNANKDVSVILPNIVNKQ